jgi:signal transduction histidine kinase
MTMQKNNLPQHAEQGIVPAWLQRLWATPVFDGDENKTRAAALLNSILLGILGIATIFVLVILIAFHNLVVLPIYGVLLAVWLGTRRWMQRGHIRSAATAFLVFLWAGLTYLAMISGGVSSPYFICYTSVILMVGLLLGGRIAVGFAAASTISGYGMYLSELYGRLPISTLPVTPFRIWFTLSANFAVAAILLYLSTRSMNQALTRARRGEQALVQKALENQQLAQEAQEANEFKSRLIGRISHELRTPLAAIYGLTEMLLYGAWGELSQGQRDTSQKILQHAQNLEILIAELLQQSQFTASKIKLNLVSFTPQSLVERAYTSFEPLAHSKGLSLTIAVADDLPAMLHGDVIKIEQILSSLLSNAVKFTEAGGVTLRLYRADANYWAISVSDTGIGIIEVVQKRLFEPFRQGDESATREYGGMGLGLALVKQLTLLMRGEVTVESEIGCGSTFTVTLPFEMPTEEGEVLGGKLHDQLR